jgi:hypothetical protein
MLKELDSEEEQKVKELILKHWLEIGLPKIHTNII